jgi:hypothetical protein
MQAITNLEQIRLRFAEWDRQCKIDQWKQNLANFKIANPPLASAVEGQTDLRLVFTGESLALQHRNPGQAEFQRTTQAHLNDLGAASREGRCHFTQEAEWLWPMVTPLLHYGTSLAWNRLDADSSRLLRQILRVRLLDSRIVGDTGLPLERPTQPVRWELIPAADAHDDYRFHLVQSDGSPLPPILAALTGHPALYLTTKAVFEGPVAAPSILDPTRETRIPAPALETAGGVNVLRNLGIDLPPALATRVQTLPYQVTIHCELVASKNLANAEDCVISAEAEAPDGRRLAWQGYNWLERTTRPRQKSDSAKNMITLYDSAVLAQAHALIEKLQLRPEPFGRGFVLRVTKKFPETFSEWLKSVPSHIHVHLAGELASLAAGEVAGRVKLDVAEVEIDWFDLSVVLDVADTTLNPDEIQLLLKAKGDFVRLPGKGWRRLRFALSDAENERLARLGLSAQELSAEPQRLHALQLADESAKTFLPHEQIERIHRRVAEIKTRVAPDLPSIVTAELRPYQLQGFHFLAYLSANRFGGILADDMGLGKTLQTLAWLVWLRQEAAAAQAGAPQPLPPALVVCPKSVMDNWRAEAERFTPGLRVRSWSLSELASFASELTGADVHVVNYSQLRTLGESLTGLRWQAVVLDEGQYIKNPNSQTAQVARALKTEQRLILSGTPIENRLLDLWSLMTFAMPGLLGSRAHFARIYGSKNDPFARHRLAARVRPFLLRRTKAQVATDLPDRIEEDLFCEMEGEQQLLYRAELKRAQQLLLGIKTQKELAEQQFHFLVSLLRLRQICCDPRLRNPESTAPSAKTEALLEQLEPLMEEGEKVLVFSQFVELLDLLRPLLDQRQWPVFYLAGHTENRGELVRNFQNSEGPAVFLISLKAGGFGLNLTAANYVVLFDPWWNPAVENQAIDRTHRIGQQNKVIAYRLLIKGSIEEKIRALQKQKKALAEDVLGEERFSQSLTLDDLKFLFAE